MKPLGIYMQQPVPYAMMADVQERLVEDRIQGDIPDMVFFLEHPPVVTLGRRGRKNFLNLTPLAYQQQGIDLIHSSRGGDVTYHAPGQIIMYPIIHIGGKEADAHGYLYNLEETAIRTAVDFGVQAERRDKKNGAWTSSGKIAAIGFRLQRWVTSHGMSFNVNLDLSGFNTIIPCGLVGEAVASLESIMGNKAPSLETVRDHLCRHFCDICDRPLTTTLLDLPNDGQSATLYESVRECLAR